MAKSFPHSFVVCKCRNVTLGEVIHSIKEKNADSIEKVGELTDAGTCCKSCQCEEKDIGVDKLELYLEQIIKKFVK